MKTSKYIFVVLITLSPLSGSGYNHLVADPIRVPDRVNHSLDSLYPKAENVEWTRRRTRYTANFVYEGRNLSITFDKRGETLSTLQEVAYMSLPERIRVKFEEFYPSYKILIILERKNADQLEYDIEIIKGKQHYILNYHPKGYLQHQYEVYRTDWTSVAM